MSNKKVFEYNFGNRNLKVEIGELAKQANGAAMIKYGDTAVLSVVAASKEASKLDFFPLMVVYQEKLYAAGKIPGGFLKREGRPSEHATLTSRLIDRPIRPLFADGFRNDVQIINNVMSNDNDAPADIAAMFGSSLALCISDVPFNGPIAGVNVGRINNEFIINPTVAEKELSDIDLIVAGTKEAINMVEAGAKQVSEKDILEAILFGHEEIKKLCAFQETIMASLEIEKMNVTLDQIEPAIFDDVVSKAKEDLVKTMSIKEKQAKQNAVNDIKKTVLKTYEGSEELVIKQVKKSLDTIVKTEVRRLITDEKIRPDGRGLDEIRPLDSQIDILQRTHGSALFTRGQTQALSITTLGSLAEHQIIDNLSEDENKRFMLHYNFPSFSVGETGRYGAPGRREIGHGALGERAISQVIPSEEEFPYTIRIVSEILESNGSTSQASICAGTLSLMAAGVPIKSPVAGIAMGLIKTNENYSILTDIQGMEDHLGDMDFKVAGTKDGITALQMDIKIDGLDRVILEQALEQARKGRLHILDNMLTAISEPREEVGEYAPKVSTFNIDPNKIRDVIGTGGKVITEIIEKSNDVKIDIEQDGRVIIQHSDIKAIKKAISLIENIVREAKVGEEYMGEVVKIEKFGAFVKLWDGCDGLLHISKISKKRLEKVEDKLKLGQVLKVKVVEVDNRGRVNLSHKEYEVVETKDSK